MIRDGDLRIVLGFPDRDRPTVAALYWEAFGPKLGRALGPRDLALDFIETCLMPDHALCARASDGSLLGVAGFKTPAGGLVAGGFPAMARVYGLPGAAWRMALLGLLRADVENRRFLIDGIFVAPHARGRGVGTALIEAIAAEGARRGYGEIRLEVIDENTRARALYERRGFTAIGRQQMGPLRLIFGFRSATTMVRRI